MTSNSKDDTSKIVIVLNQSFSFECIAENSNPAANFSWFIDSQELTVGGDIVEISKRTISVSNKLHKTTGKLVYKASNTDWNGKMLKCEAFAHSGTVKSSSIADTKRIQVNRKSLSTIILFLSFSYFF